VFDIRDSEIDGQGVFASENIKKNCIIGPAYTIIGEVNGKYIAGDITILGLMHNHSLKPTARPEMYNNTIYFEAIRNIEEGEEVTCDYTKYSNVTNIEEPLKEWQ
jgi:SET domain-containing protein